MGGSGYPKRKRMRLEGFDYDAPGFAYSITICTHRGKQVFGEPRAAQAVVAELRRLGGEGIASVHCYCVMPDHVHVVLSVREGGPGLPSAIRRLKTWVCRRLHEAGTEGPVWQRSYYQHIVRAEEGLAEVCEYVLANPVRKGLAAAPEQWPYSGFLEGWL